MHAPRSFRRRRLRRARAAVGVALATIACAIAARGAQAQSVAIPIDEQLAALRAVAAEMRRALAALDSTNKARCAGGSAVHCHAASMTPSIPTWFTSTADSGAVVPLARMLGARTVAHDTVGTPACIDAHGGSAVLVQVTVSFTGEQSGRIGVQQRCLSGSPGGPYVRSTVFAVERRDGHWLARTIGDVET